MAQVIAFVRPIDDTSTRTARVELDDARRLMEELNTVPGGPAESPSTADAATLLEAAIANRNGDESVPVPDGQAEAIHWALERMMAADVALSAGLDELRDVVRLA